MTCVAARRSLPDLARACPLPLRLAPPRPPQDAVRLCDAQGEELARALINYSHDEVDRIKVGRRRSSNHLIQSVPET